MLIGPVIGGEAGFTIVLLIADLLCFAPGWGIAQKRREEVAARAMPRSRWVGFWPTVLDAGGHPPGETCGPTDALLGARKYLSVAALQAGRFRLVPLSLSVFHPVEQRRVFTR